MGAALHLRIPPALKTGPRLTALLPAYHIYLLGQRTPRLPTGSDPSTSDSGSGTAASVSCQSSIDSGDNPSAQEHARASNEQEPKQQRGKEKQETKERKQGLKHVIQKFGQHNEQWEGREEEERTTGKAMSLYARV